MSHTGVVSGTAGQRASGKRSGNPRNAELMLLLVAMFVVLCLSAAAQAGTVDRVDMDAVIPPAILTVLFLIAHFVVRFLAPYADPILMPCVAMLNGIGVVFIRRLDLGKFKDPDERSAVSLFAFNAQNQFAKDNTSGVVGFKQIIFTVIAIAVFVAVLIILRDHRLLSRYSYTLGIGGLVFVMIPAILPSSLSEVNGAKIWIKLPFISIQPGEFAKMALCVFIASYLVSKRDVLSLASKRFVGIDLPRGRDLGPILAAWGLTLLVLVFEKDLGSALMYFGMFVAMLYVATERVSWLLIGLTMFAGAAVAAWLLVARLQLRVFIWLHPFADPDDKGYQLVQSLFGMATGGLFGKGPGSGSPNIVPENHTDFIMTSIGEETGLFGLAAILLLYAIISIRGVKAATDVRDSFGKLLAGGLAFSIGLQVFVIVGGISGLIPLTGITTPWLSYGGSSLLANWLLLALLLRVSDAGRRPATPASAPVQLKTAATEVIRL